MVSLKKTNDKKTKNTYNSFTVLDLCFSCLEHKLLYSFVLSRLRFRATQATYRVEILNTESELTRYKGVFQDHHTHKHPTVSLT